MWAEPQEVTSVGLLILVAVRDNADTAHWQHGLDRRETLRTNTSWNIPNPCLSLSSPWALCSSIQSLSPPRRCPWSLNPTGCLLAIGLCNSCCLLLNSVLTWLFSQKFVSSLIPHRDYKFWETVSYSFCAFTDLGRQQSGYTFSDYLNTSEQNLGLGTYYTSGMETACYLCIPPDIETACAEGSVVTQACFYSSSEPLWWLLRLGDWEEDRVIYQSIRIAQTSSTGNKTQWLPFLIVEKKHRS